MTWGQLRAYCERALAANGEERPARLVLDWFDDVFGRASRRSAEEVPSASAAVAKTQLDELLVGKPLAYVTGVAHFYGDELEVAEGVLIPRPETEELVRWVLEAHGTATSLDFLDLCTGSGCIAVALALRRLRWRGVAIDVSPFALEVTRRNIGKHDLADQLDVRQADILSMDWALPDAAFDLITSNPPYIPDADWGRVGAEVRDYEPHLALRVTDEDPLAFYRAITREAIDGLRHGGWLYFECNDRWAERVAELLRAASFTEVDTFVDMQGRLRHVRGRKG